MGMNTHVEGFRRPDEESKRMKAIYDLCTESKIEVPEAVESFFDDEAPAPVALGVKINIQHCLEEISEEMDQIYQIDISKLPEDLMYIRFINSY